MLWNEIRSEHDKQINRIVSNSFNNITDKIGKQYIEMFPEKKIKLNSETGSTVER